MLISAPRTFPGMTPFVILIATSTLFMVLLPQPWPRDTYSDMAAEHVPGLHTINQRRAPSTDNNATSLSFVEEAASQGERRFPDCLIVGVRNGGTGHLEHFLSQHPSIVTRGAELHFFNLDSVYALGLDWYRSQMPPARPDQIVIESTADYFYSPQAPMRVRDMSSHIKLILVVGEPVQTMIEDYFYQNRALLGEAPRAAGIIRAHQRSLQHLLFNATSGQLNHTYHGLEVSNYVKFTKNWLRWLPLNHIHILDRGEIVLRNPATEVRRIEQFLGLTPRTKKDHFFFSNLKGSWCLRTTGCVKVRKGPGRLPELVKLSAKQYFKPLNAEFSKLVGKNFRW